MAQLVTQVAGRAGRSGEPGKVLLLQTHFPEHPLLQDLVNNGYQDFARYALNRTCKKYNLPPYASPRNRASTKRPTAHLVYDIFI